MPIRTDVSEDPKGDPSKLIPNQHEPRRRDEEVEPLLPDQADAAPSRRGKTARTPADQRGLDRERKKA